MVSPLWLVSPFKLSVAAAATPAAGPGTCMLL